MPTLQRGFALDLLPIEPLKAGEPVDWSSPKVLRQPTSETLTRAAAHLVRRPGNESRHDGSHIVTSFPVQKFYIIGLPNGTARYIDHGVGVASSDGVLMCDFSDFRNAEARDIPTIEVADNGPVRLDRPLLVISLSHVNAAHYSHWMQQAMPALMAAKWLGLDCHVGVRRITRKQREMLGFMGYGEADIIDFEDGQTYTAPLVLSTNNQVPVLAPEHYAIFDDLSARVPDDGSDHPLIYISRIDEQERLIGGDHVLGYRMLWNEQELVHRLERMGFHCVTPSQNTLTANINLFRKARIIVGGHGAGLTDIVFSDGGKAAVLALLEPDYYYWGPHNAAGVRGLPFYMVFGENFYSMSRGPFRDTHNNFIIDVDLVERTIHQAAARIGL